MSYVDDGILDIFAGMLALFAGLLFFAEMFWMAGVYVAIFLPVVWSMKEKVTMPRLRPEELPMTTQARLQSLIQEWSFFAQRPFLERKINRIVEEINIPAEEKGRKDQ